MIGELVGNYRIIRQLGAGGMGVVYLGQHQTIGRKAAIKLLLPQYSADAEMVTRIFNEARSAALIDHPGLVDIYDFGTHDNGSAYLVMEYLEGESLSSFLRRQGKLSPELVVSLGRQVASAVGAAHRQGIVHRDLKPDNVFLVRDEEVSTGIRARVLDFGIAKLAADSTPGSMKTRTGVIMGTPIYMSPEQCRGAGAVDHRADVYSLGVMLYEMVCGRPPFVAEGMGEIIAAQLYAAPLPPSQVEPSVPGWLEAILLRMLAKSPDQRQDSMERVIAELGGTISGRAGGTSSATLEVLAGPQGVTAFMGTPPPMLRTPPPMLRTPPPALRLGAHSGPTTTFGGAAAELREPPRRRRGLWIGLGAGGLIAAAAVYFLVQRGGNQHAQASPPVAAPMLAPIDAGSPDSARVVVVEPSPPPAPTQVTLHIESRPKGATVFLASTGVRLGVTPFDYRLPSSPGHAVFLLLRAGHADREVELPADRDGTITAELVKLKRPRPKPGEPDIGSGAIDPFSGQ